MKRRRRWNTRLLLPHILRIGLLGSIMIASTAGFAYFGYQACYRQIHFAPGDEHPWDYWAYVCFTIGGVALGLFWLSEPTDPPIRWLYRRVTRSGTWRRARQQQPPSERGVGRAKRRRDPRP